MSPKSLALALALAVLPSFAWAAKPVATTVVTLNLSAKGATITVDGKANKKPADTAFTTTLPRGKHTIVVELDGYRKFEQELDLKAAKQSFAVTLEVIPPPPPPVAEKPAEPPPPVVEKPHGRRIVVIDLPYSTTFKLKLRTDVLTEIVAQTRAQDGVTVMDETEYLGKQPAWRADKIRKCDDEACFLALELLDVDELLIPSLLPVKSKTLFGLRLLDFSTHSLRNSAQLEATSESTLLASIAPVVANVVSDKPLPPPPPEEAPVTEAPKKKRGFVWPEPLPTGVFYATASAGVAAAIVGTVYGIAANSNQAAYASLAYRSQTQPVPSSKLLGYQNQATAQANGANIAFICAGVLGVGALTEAIFTNWRGIPPSDAHPVAVELSPAGVMVSWK